MTDLAEDRKKFEQFMRDRKLGILLYCKKDDRVELMWMAYQAGLKEAGRARPLGKTLLCMCGHLSSSHHLGKECLGVFYPNFSGGGGWTGCQCKRFESNAGDALVAQTQQPKPITFTKWWTERDHIFLDSLGRKEFAEQAYHAGFRDANIKWCCDECVCGGLGT